MYSVNDTKSNKQTNLNILSHFRHFYPELSAMLEATDNPTQCFECPFKAEKTEYVARHLGTVHCKLEELLNDPDLLAKKSEEYRGIRPGSATPGTPTEALPTKVMADHVTWETL